jgi:hypothetical protein
MDRKEPEIAERVPKENCSRSRTRYNKRLLVSTISEEKSYTPAIQIQHVLANALQFINGTAVSSNEGYSGMRCGQCDQGFYSFEVHVPYVQMHLCLLPGNCRWTVLKRDRLLSL